VEERSIGLEELGQQTFDPMPVDVGDWVEKLEIDVYELLGWKSKNMETAASQSLPSRPHFLPPAFFLTSFIGSSGGKYPAFFAITSSEEPSGCCEPDCSAS